MLYLRMLKRMAVECDSILADYIDLKWIEHALSQAQGFAMIPNGFLQPEEHEVDFL